MGSHNRSAHLQGHKDANMVTHFFPKGDVFREAFSENLRQIAEFGNILMQVVSWGQYMTSQTHVSWSLVKKEKHDDCKLGMVEWSTINVRTCCVQNHDSPI